MKFLIFLPLLLPILGAFLIYTFKYRKFWKNCFIFAILFLTLALTIINCFINVDMIDLIFITRNLSLSFHIDKLSMFFSIAISFVWLFVGIYTFEYIKHEKNENRFYTFYLLTLSMLLALCYSANLITMYLCFEMVTLLSMPLVLHSLSNESVFAAKKYLFYSLGGAFLALLGIFFLVHYSGNAPFGKFGGMECFKEGVFTGNQTLFHVVIFLLIIGFATKSGMYPMHGWLPVAHPVAPSSASAVLSGVITKAGIIAIIRVIYYVVGPDFLINTWVQYAFLALACFSVFMGSLLATLEKNFKKRLAYSSISQLSYILIGLALMNNVSFLGALLHVAAHMLIKVCLFLFAGELIYKFDKYRVDELKDIGTIMPISTGCYTIAALGLIGIPFTGGFISKWYLANGALSSNLSVFNYLVPIVLLLSAILTAAYLLPISFHGYFTGNKKCERNEAKKTMYVPLMVLTICIVVLGVFYEPLIDFIWMIMGN